MMIRIDALPPLSVSGLSKSYGTFIALAPTSFCLNAGEIVAISGPNGSGKTTLLLCLAGLIRASSGTVTIKGFDLYQEELEIRRRMVFIPDVPRFYLELTAWEHLRFIAFANNDAYDFESRAEALLRKFGLWEARNIFPHHFSRGMRLKLGLALGFIRPFDVLLLDEPTSALDAEGTRVLVDQLIGLRDDGKTIFLSSHDQKILDNICDRRMAIREGVIEVEES